MQKKRFFRYLAPNVVTLASLAFGMLAIGASLEGRFYDASWFICFGVLTDKLDGFVARLVKGTSELGVQLDSFADFVNFGIAPGVIWYAFFSRFDGLPFTSGWGYGLLVASCMIWILAVTFRLARYNIVGDDPSCKRLFFGVPTTLMGGLLIVIFLTCLKYADASTQALARASFHEPGLPGLATTRTVWLGFPAYILFGAYLMASTLKVPKLGGARSKAVTVFVFANVFLGYVFGFARVFPEYMALMASIWIGASLVWGRVNPIARAARAPAVFPPEARPIEKRPEEDGVPDDDPAPDGA